MLQQKISSLLCLFIVLLPKPLTNDRWRETGERTAWLCDLVAIFYIVFFFPAQFLLKVTYQDTEPFPDFVGYKLKF
jgi:hypothetical protein